VIHKAAADIRRSFGVSLCDGRARRRSPSDQTISRVTIEADRYPNIWLSRSFPCRRANTVGMMRAPTTRINSQAGPIDRGSGRARRSPPTASRANIAGQRGSRCLERVVISVYSCIDRRAGTGRASRKLCASPNLQVSLGRGWTRDNGRLCSAKWRTPGECCRQPLGCD
jgi:hypothetical protein